MTFGNYVLFNLLVAILVEGFSEDKQSYCDSTDSPSIQSRALRLIQSEGSLLERQLGKDSRPSRAPKQASIEENPQLSPQPSIKTPTQPIVAEPSPMPARRPPSKTQTYHRRCASLRVKGEGRRTKSQRSKSIMSARSHNGSREARLNQHRLSIFDITSGRLAPGPDRGHLFDMVDEVNQQGFGSIFSPSLG